MIQPNSYNRIPYRSDIDGLRAIAVLSVVAFHLFQGRARGGFVGVDIFFVISGYLISSIIYNDLQSGTFSIREFYVRRVRRIYPALSIVLAAVCVAGWCLLLPTEFEALGKQIIGGSTFVANFVAWWQSGYFEPSAAQRPLMNLWSLGVEEQYYLIFPLICLAFYRTRWRWILPAAFVAIATVSMAINVVFVTRYRDAVYFLPFSRLWELLLGAGLALWLHRKIPAGADTGLPSRGCTALGFCGLALLGVSIFGIDQYQAFPGWFALLPTMGAALVITAGQSSWVNRHILSCKPVVFVGLISYPLYLWHWPILSFIRIVGGRPWGHDISHLLKLAVAALSFLLAYLTYRFIELPIRQVKQRKLRYKGAAWMLASVSVTGVFGIVVVVSSGFPARLPSRVVALDHDYGPEVARSWREGTCFLRSDQSADSFGGNCVDPSPVHEVQPIVLVWGDSHAADLLPGFRALQRQSGVRLAQYTASLCAPILGLQIRIRPSCMAINDAVMDRIRLLKPEIVVLSAHWDYPDPDHDRATRAEKLRQTIEQVKAAGVPRVAVIGSAPFWRSPVPELLLEEVRRNPERPLPDRLARSLLAVHDDSLLRSTVQRAAVGYIPVFDRLCDSEGCLATTGPDWRDVVTYDYSHFTEHGSLLVAQHIWPSIMQAVVGTNGTGAGASL
jgi:peptidoglycan/LPS O-acetylase OafA/YrhL